MNEKYQLYYYWNHGMCDQCGAPILILNEALSYEGNDQQELQAFLDEHAECRYFSNKDEQKNFEENGGCKKLEETYNYKSPYWAMRSVGSKSLLGQFCCRTCREKWIREREADHLKISNRPPAAPAAHYIQRKRPLRSEEAAAAFLNVPAYGI